MSATSSFTPSPTLGLAVTGVLGLTALAMRVWASSVREAVTAGWVAYGRWTKADEGEYSVAEMNAALSSFSFGPVVSVEEVGELSGGMIGRVRKVLVTFEDGSSLDLVLKSVTKGDASRRHSIVFGGGREGVMYSFVRSPFNKGLPGMEHISRMMPVVYAADGSVRTGGYRIAMECMDGDHDVLVNKVLGDQFRGNTADVNIDHATSLLAAVAQDVGNLHGLTLGAEEWTHVSWLRGNNWAFGNDKAGWEAMFAMGRDGWANGKAAVQALGSDYSQLISFMDASFEDSTWSGVRSALDKLLGTNTFCLNHGDCHGGNVFLRSPLDDSDLNLAWVDWCVVGLGPLGADLAQFVISDVHPDVRRKVELSMVASYHQTLVSTGAVDPESFTEQDAFAAYAGPWGIGRWVWLLGVLAGFNLPAPMLEYFVQQVDAFVSDHCSYHPVLVHCL